MKMGSWSISKKWLVLLAVTMVLVGNSLALKCHVCYGGSLPCEEKDCGTASEYMCKTTVNVETNEKTKICDFAAAWDIILEGTDTCRTGSIEDFEMKRIKAQYKNQQNPTQKEEEYVKQQFDFYKMTDGQGQDLTKEKTICSCKTDLCNTDANDDALLAANKGKKLNTGNGKGAATTLLANSGNLGAVMFLALAVLAALVPGSGFPRSQ